MSPVKEKELLLIDQESTFNQRIDIFLADHLHLSRSMIQKLIQEGLVWVNEKKIKASYRIQSQDKIQYHIPPSQPLDLKPIPMDLDFLFEDDDILIVNKPAQLVTHPSPGHWGRSLVHGILSQCTSLSGIGGVARPGIVHRLDKDTSGCLIIAKHDQSHNILIQMFKNREINKKYIGIVSGTPKENQGVIQVPVKRGSVDRKKMVTSSEGKKSVTEYRVLRKGSRWSVLMYYPKTGRTHQIRVHSSSIGHTILGDPLYGPGEDLKVNIPRLMLHAFGLDFKHPIQDKWIHVKSKVPEDMKNVIRKLSYKM